MDGNKSVNQPQVNTASPQKPNEPLKRNDDDDDNDQYAYRGGPNNATNLTPRPGIDDGSGIKSELSSFLDPISATRGQGGKVQKLSIKKLKAFGFEVNIAPDGHVGIRPKSGEALKAWAQTRSEVINGGAASPLYKTHPTSYCW